MSRLSKDQILAAADLVTEIVSVPEWGGDVVVATLPRHIYDAYEDSLSKRVGRRIESSIDNFTARLCALCMVDENGNRLFSDDDVAALGKKSSGALQRVFDVAMKLNRPTATLEEKSKNS